MSICISEIKTVLVSTMLSFHRSLVFYTSNEHHQKLCTKAFASPRSSLTLVVLVVDRRWYNVSELDDLIIVIVSKLCVRKLSNANGDNLDDLDPHLAQTPMKLTTMGVDPKTKQVTFILISCFT